MQSKQEAKSMKTNESGLNKVTLFFGIAPALRPTRQPAAARWYEGDKPRAQTGLSVPLKTEKFAGWKPFGQLQSRKSKLENRNWRNQNAHLKVAATKATSGGCVDAGADFLPALGALLGVEDFLAKADRFRSDFDVFVVGNELDGFLKRHIAGRDQPDGFVGGR